MHVLIQTFSSGFLVQFVLSAPNFANDLLSFHCPHIVIDLGSTSSFDRKLVDIVKGSKYEMNSLFPRLLPPVSLENIPQFPPMVYFFPFKQTVMFLVLKSVSLSKCDDSQ